MVKVGGVIATILSIVLIIAAVMLARDAIDLQQNMKTGDKKFLLEIDHRLEAGITIGNVYEFEKQETFAFLEDIYELNEYYIDERYDELLGDSYKLFIFKKEAFADVDTVKFNAIELTPEEAFQIIEHFDEREEFARVTGVEMKFIEALYDSDNKLETFLFARLIFSPLEQEGPFWLIKNIKNGNIVIYPKTITFVLAKLIPNSVFENMLTTEQVEKIKKQ